MNTSKRGTQKEFWKPYAYLESTLRQNRSIFFVLPPQHEVNKVLKKVVAVGTDDDEDAKTLFMSLVTQEVLVLFKINNTGAAATNVHVNQVDLVLIAMISMVGFTGGERATSKYWRELCIAEKADLNTEELLAAATLEAAAATKGPQAANATAIFKHLSSMCSGRRRPFVSFVRTSSSPVFLLGESKMLDCNLWRNGQIFRLKS